MCGGTKRGGRGGGEDVVVEVGSEGLRDWRRRDSIEHMARTGGDGGTARRSMA